MWAVIGRLSLEQKVFVNTRGESSSAGDVMSPRLLRTALSTDASLDPDELCTLTGHTPVSQSLVVPLLL